MRNPALRAQTACHIAAQIEQAVSVGRVGEQQRVQRRRADMLPLVGNQNTEQGKIIKQHKKQPDANRHARRAAALFGNGA